MLVCVAMSFALPCQTALRGLNSGCLSLGFLSGVGPLQQAGSQKWLPEGLVNEQPLPLIGQDWQVSSFFTWLKKDQLQGSASRQQTEVLCLLVFGRSQSFQMLTAALFLQFSVLCYCWCDCSHTKVERKLHRQVAVGVSVSSCIMAGPGTLRCLQVSAILCVLF
jgi:hypothetical protein